MLAPLTNAGFKVERVVSPCNALAALARVKTCRAGRGRPAGSQSTAPVLRSWSSGPGKQIYAHSFPWDSTVGFSGSQARLLQRYSLVSFLSPEIKAAMAEARASGFPVEAIVTCGNLPDLRALTMPLIEELDTEVETLDSLEGLTVAPTATDRLTESAAAIRLACAGAIARPSRPWDDSKRAAAERQTALIRVAAVLALLAGIAAAYAGYFEWRDWRRAPSAPVMAAAQKPPRPQAVPSTPQRTSAEPPVPPSPTAPLIGSPDQPRVNRPLGAESIGSQAPPNGSRSSVHPPEATAAARGATVPARPAPPVLLRDPLPRVTAILISNERRFATVDGGQIIGIGDALGRRVVVDIDERALVLREPSGVHVRVGLGGRLLGAGRAE